MYQKKLGGAIAIVDKRRSSATETKQANLIGASLEGKVAVIFDDMISTAGSVVGAANVARCNGAREIYACATHAVLCGPAIERLRDAPIKQDRRHRQHPAAAGKAAAEHQGAQRGPPAGRRHQAHSLQRVGEQAVRVTSRRRSSQENSVGLAVTGRSGGKCNGLLTPYAIGKETLMALDTSKYGFSTRAIHAGQEADPATGDGYTDLCDVHLHPGGAWPPQGIRIFAQRQSDAHGGS